MTQNNPVRNSYDIIIVGAGLIGLVQALFCARRGYKTLCLDSKAALKPARDRTTAISSGSAAILEQCGVWQDIKPTGAPINNIDILHNGSAPYLTLCEDNNEPLGLVFKNSDLFSGLEHHICAQKNLTLSLGTYISHIEQNDETVLVETENGDCHTAALLIGADGRQSFVRRTLNIPDKKWSYHQTAITAMITHQHDHKNKAVEDFKGGGPFAVLPMADEKGRHRSSIVWTLEDEKTARAFADKKDLLTIAVQEQIPARYGAISDLDNVQSYPLTFNRVYSPISGRCVLIGDAAHGIHPIAGQGLNLGLRDVDALQNLFADKAVMNNVPALLTNYARARENDLLSMAAATDMLNRLFTKQSFAKETVRKIGLKFLSHMPRTQRKIVRAAMGQSLLKK